MLFSRGDVVEQVYRLLMLQCYHRLSIHKPRINRPTAIQGAKLGHDVLQPNQSLWTGLVFSVSAIAVSDRCLYGCMSMDINHCP
jgi:hypothetical protein